jgi:phosphotriesterase-related protein
VDVVMGCGRYIAESRPGDEGLTAEDYRDEILAEFARRPRPAVIGEIGTGDPIAETERRSLHGAAQAQARLGVPLYVHLHPWGRTGHEALDLVAAAGGALSRVVLCHLDPPIPGGLDYHRSLMDRGATIAFDIWGDELDYGAVAMPSDDQRLSATLELVERGFGGRLVHSHDVCTKTQLRRWGGAGFDHLPRRVAPRMRDAGLDEAEVHRQLAGNVTALLLATEAS